MSNTRTYIRLSGFLIVCLFYQQIKCQTTPMEKIENRYTGASYRIFVSVSVFISLIEYGGHVFFLFRLVLWVSLCWMDGYIKQIDVESKSNDFTCDGIVLCFFC